MGAKMFAEAGEGIKAWGGYGDVAQFSLANPPQCIVDRTNAGTNF